MNKKWKKINDSSYEFLMGNKVVGTMELNISLAQSSAHSIIENKKLEIKRTGFWKHNIEISNAESKVLLKVYPEKWYANTWQIEFENRKLKLAVRNNPFAEYVITENKKEILAYGLFSDNGKLAIRIISGNQDDLILDFLLWYLFVPIANENFGNHYLFADQ
ncbi:MAG TPA: hypothetical protein VMT76_01375 [Puia sp.]|nr:hypothetical protein [Puia sp.]